MRWTQFDIDNLPAGMVIKDHTAPVAKNRVIVVEEREEARKELIKAGIMKKPASRHPEDDIQRSCFTWFKFQYPAYSKRIFSIPNGGKRNAVTAAIMKGTGTLSGTWDIFLSVPKFGFSGFYIEIKAGKNDLTDNQIEFRDANDRDYLFKVCRSLDEFKKEIDKYLK